METQTPDSVPPSIRAFREEKAPRPRLFEGFERPSGRLEIEIGCGTGLYAQKSAPQDSTRTLIAIEHTHERFGKFQRRLEKEGCPSNLVPVHANAISWITHAVGEAWVDRYWLLYPNPYPKTRDRGLRWHAMPFFHKLLSTLRPGGELVLATNLKWYADEAENHFRSVWGLTITARDEITQKSCETQGFVPRTAFEKKYLERGETCHEVRAVK